MTSSAARVIKLSVNLKPFVSRVSRNGRVQRAFAEQIGRPVGGCVAGGVHAGMSGGAIRRVVKDCAKSVRGTRLSLPAAGRALRAAATEYYEIE